VYVAVVYDAPTAGADWRAAGYLTDPAAWGALMERELEGWETCYLPARRMRCTWIVGARSRSTRVWGPWAGTLSRAVVLAVLAKHGRDTSRYTEGEAPHA
jgi:hypothetical protein